MQSPEAWPRLQAPDGQTAVRRVDQSIRVLRVSHRHRDLRQGRCRSRRARGGFEVPLEYPVLLVHRSEPLRCGERHSVRAPCAGGPRSGRAFPEEGPSRDRSFRRLQGRGADRGHLRPSTSDGSGGGLELVLHLPEVPESSDACNLARHRNDSDHGYDDGIPDDDHFDYTHHDDHHPWRDDDGGRRPRRRPPLQPPAKPLPPKPPRPRPRRRAQRPGSAAG